MSKLKLLSLFSGIGAFEKALDNINVPYELVNFCEFDKYATKSYCAIHNVSESKNLGDITKVDLNALKEHSADIVTYGFPCTDISLAGKMDGFYKQDGTLTRSGLFFYASDIIGKVKPKVAICENVKNLTSKKFAKEFQIVLDTLTELGYTNYWKVLNAKDYGIPQNRERVFIVSIRNDIDDGFEFPKPVELKLKLKDMLQNESEIDEKYYLSQKMLNYLTADGTRKFPRRERFISNITRENQDIANTIVTQAGTNPTDNYVVEVPLKRGYSVEVKPEQEDTMDIDVIGNYSKSKYNQTSIVGKNGIAPTMTENHGQVTAISIKNATKQGYLLAEEGDGVDISGRIQWHRGTVQKGISQTITTNGGNHVGVVIKELKKVTQYWVSEKGVKFITDPKRGMATDINPNIAQPLTAKGQQNWTGSFISPNIDHIEKSSILGSKEPTKIVMKNGDVLINDGGPHFTNESVKYNLRIRKLTPQECFALQGFDKESYLKTVEAGISNSQAYKQAGNSICVDVLMHLFKQVFAYVDLGVYGFEKQEIENEQIKFKI